MISLEYQLRSLICVSITVFLTIHFTAADGDYDVIVIGAGPSGIAAATRLLENGLDNFIILEAEDRIGGRINSVQFGSAIVDLGAEFTTSDAENIVYDFGKEFLREGNMDFDMVHSTGELVDKELSKELYGFVSSYETLDRSTNDYYVTIGDYFLEKYNETILRKYEHSVEKLQICYDALGTLESCVCYLEGAFDWFKPALNNPYAKSSEGVEWNLNWNGLGFKTVLELLMNNKDQDIRNRILMNTQVAKILWGNTTNKVEIICADESTYKTRHVIFTPSVGVLKNYGEMFIPNLSDEKSRCIDTLGFDAIFKIHAHFPQKWWPDDFTYKMFIWSREDRQNLDEEFPSGPMKDGASWVGNIYHIYPAANNPNVLGIWITGSVIPELESTSIMEIQDGISFALIKFLGKTYNVTAPDEIIHSSWYTNPHFHGSYSYDTVQSLRLGYNCHDILAESLHDANSVPSVLFAGEAANSIHYSTVHGAIETGHREADRIWELYAKKQNI